MGIPVVFLKFLQRIRDCEDFLVCEVIFQNGNNRSNFLNIIQIVSQLSRISINFVPYNIKPESSSGISNAIFKASLSELILSGDNVPIKFVRIDFGKLISASQ